MAGSASIAEIMKYVNNFMSMDMKPVVNNVYQFFSRYVFANVFRFTVISTRITRYSSKKAISRDLLLKAQLCEHSIKMFGMEFKKMNYSV